MAEGVMSADTESTGRFECPSNFNEKEHTVNEELCVEDLENQDSEFWLFQTPREFDLSLLKDKFLSLNENTTFDKENCLEEEKTHEILSTTNIPKELLTYQLLLPSKSEKKLAPVSLPFTGFLQLIESIDVPSFEFPTITSKELIKFDDVKQRYVPFGSDNPLVIPNSWTKHKVHKKKKKKRHKSSSQSDIDHFSLNGNKSFSQNYTTQTDPCLPTNFTKLKENYTNHAFVAGDHSRQLQKQMITETTKKSHKKKKNRFAILEDNSDVSAPSFDSDDICWHPEDLEEKLKKRKKYNKQDSYASEQLETNRDNLFMNMSSSNDHSTDNDNQNITLINKSRKKSKGYKSTLTDKPDQNGNDSFITLTEKSHKKENRNYKDEQNALEQNFSILSPGKEVVNSINNEKSKKRKRHHEDSSVSEHNQCSDDQTSKKKDKKKRKHDLESAVNVSIEEEYPTDTYTLPVQMQQDNLLDQNEGSTLINDHKKKKKKHKHIKQEIASDQSKVSSIHKMHKHKKKTKH